MLIFQGVILDWLYHTESRQTKKNSSADSAVAQKGPTQIAQRCLSLD